MSEQVPTLDVETHTYRLGSRLIPGVTSILKRVGAIDDRWWGSHHAERGKRIHEATELYDEGLLSAETCDPEIAPYVEAWAKCCSDTGLEIIASEAIVYHADLDYAGTLDRLVRIKGRAGVLDIKSGSPAHHHALQIAAYALAVVPARPLKRWGCYLTERGTYSIVEYQERADKDTWIAMVQTARWLRERMSAA